MKAATLAPALKIEELPLPLNSLGAFVDDQNEELLIMGYVFLSFGQSVFYIIAGSVDK